MREKQVTKGKNAKSRILKKTKKSEEQDLAPNKKRGPRL